MAPQFFDPSGKVRNRAGNLPHWRQEGVIYFVTFRLADSLPKEKLARWTQERDAWLALHPFPHDEQMHGDCVRRFVTSVKRWLDQGSGECLMGDARCREIVERALRYFDGQRYTLDEFVVMPNHVHVLVTPVDGVELSGILHSWKSFSAKEINGMLRRRGSVWQHEAFDHIVRSQERLEKFRRYIQNNAKWWSWHTRKWER